MNAENRELMLRLAHLLDAAVPLLDKEAAAEKRREAGKPLRSMTAQLRAESAREAVALAFAALDAEVS